MSVGYDGDRFAQMLTESCRRDEVAALNSSGHGKYNASSRILPKDMIPERIGTDMRAGYSCHIDKGT